MTDLPWPNISVVTRALASKHDWQIFFWDHCQQLRLVVTAKNLQNTWSKVCTSAGCSIILAGSSSVLLYAIGCTLAQHKSVGVPGYKGASSAHLDLCQCSVIQEALDDTPEAAKHPRSVDHEHTAKVLWEVVL